MNKLKPVPEPIEYDDSEVRTVIDGDYCFTDLGTDAQSAIIMDKINEIIRNQDYLREHIQNLEDNRRNK